MRERPTGFVNDLTGTLSEWCWRHDIDAFTDGAYSQRCVSCGRYVASDANGVATVSTPVQNLTLPPVENLTVRRGDEPQIVAAS
jgi:hypothetical protein